MGALYSGSHNLIELRALTDQATSAAITTATVTATVYGPDGVAVSGHAWPITLSHVSAGTYRGTVTSAAAIQPGIIYTVKITASTATSPSTVRIFTDTATGY